MKQIAIGFVLLLSTVSCSRNYNGASAQNFTLGAVQLKVERGMSQDAVAEALGSPSLVTKDDEGVSTWIYDKIGTNVEYHESGGGFWLVIAGAGGSCGGARTTQQTLTAVIKFDAAQKVENVTYHSSKF